MRSLIAHAKLHAYPRPETRVPPSRPNHPCPPDQIPTTIHKVGFRLPKPFKEGHQLTASEAEALNFAFADNIRENKRKWVGQMLDQGVSPEEIQDQLWQYAQEYRLGMSKKREEKAPDPIELEARKIAKSRLNHQWKLANPDMVEDAVNELLDLDLTIHLEAERRVALARKIAEDNLVDLMGRV